MPFKKIFFAITVIIILVIVVDGLTGNMDIMFETPSRIPEVLGLTFLFAIMQWMVWNTGSFAILFPETKQVLLFHVFGLGACLLWGWMGWEQIHQNPILALYLSPLFLQWLFGYLAIRQARAAAPDLTPLKLVK